MSGEVRLALDWGDVCSRAGSIATRLSSKTHHGINIYGVPRGGVYAALAVCNEMNKLKFPLAFDLVDDPDKADVFIDDIIDSGKTMHHYRSKYNTSHFYALVNKQKEDAVGTWFEFPWERMNKEQGVEDNITRILQFIGENPEREGLKETPHRVARSYAELFAGYKMDVKDVLKTFNDGKCDEMVICRNIEFYSTCEHHMLPFIGKAHVAYVPKEKIIGLSKLARIVDIFSRRLQVQERLTTQITEALDTYLEPLGSACVIVAQHLCCACRGVQKQESEMITSSLTGVFRQQEVRAEFLDLIKQ